MSHADLVSDYFPLIYLASNSPRRHELLNQIGVRHDILKVPSPEGEDEPQLPEESAQDYVQRTALEKAQRALAFIEKEELLIRPVLAADTTVILDGNVLGKPKDSFDAARILSQLSGKTHEVHTAIVLAFRGNLYQHVSITTVNIRTLTLRDITLYINSGEYIGKAGAYAIQGLASAFIERIEGSYSGVMGLPLHDTWKLLEKIT